MLERVKPMLIKEFIQIARDPKMLRVPRAALPLPAPVSRLSEVTRENYLKYCILKNTPSNTDSSRVVRV